MPRPLHLALALLAAFTNTATTAQESNGTDLQSRLDALVAHPALDGARVGVLVLDLADGTTLAEHDAGHGFMTASNMKLIASSVALQTLGADFRFATTLVAHGPISDGVLNGDLVLVGSGDPTLGGRQEEHPAAVFERLAHELKVKHGITRITGNVLGDDDCHPDEVMGEGWAWGYQGDGYAAQVSGLCFAENCVKVHVTPNGPDRAPTVRIEPAAAAEFFDVENRATVGAAESGSRTWVTRRRATNTIAVGGWIAADRDEYVATCSVENPTAYAAHTLRAVLIAQGIQVDGQALDRDQRPEMPDRYGDETVLATHHSAPLAEILVTLNKVSQNLYAEQVIRAAARHARGNGGMPTAAAHAKATLKSYGVDPTGMRIADGSGLTRLNLVRPRQLAALLTGIWSGPHRDVFLPTLPITGVDGTLRNRFAEGPAKGHVHAKTGSISSVIGLSGFVMRADAGRPPLVFSILVNNYTSSTASARGQVDAFVHEMARAAGW